MSDEPRNIVLERIRRLTQAAADLSENQSAQNRAMLRMMTQLSEQLAAFTMTQISWRARPRSASSSWARMQS